MDSNLSDEFKLLTLLRIARRHKLLILYVIKFLNDITLTKDDCNYLIFIYQHQNHHNLNGPLEILLRHNYQPGSHTDC